VFGEGRTGVSITLVGEQPGDQEDKQGHPFVGPAGRILDRALVEAGIDRDDVYVTNAVKHFKWTERGKRRIHQRPNGTEIRACGFWLEAELGAADRGSALHDALDEFLKAYPSGLLPPDAIDRFEGLGEKHLEALLTAPAERAFWWPRFQRLARWFVATENARRAAGTKLLASETNGAITVGPPGRPLRIDARADRIDEIEPGGWEIIDYKTGRVPSPKELDGLFAPQLLLEAAMAEQGGFEGIKGKARAVHLSYWQANGLGSGGEVKEIKGSEQLVPAMLALVAKMAEHFANPATPYAALPWPEFIPHFNDYAHLERVAEWSTAGGGEE